MAAIDSEDFDGRGVIRMGAFVKGLWLRHHFRHGSPEMLSVWVRVAQCGKLWRNCRARVVQGDAEKLLQLFKRPVNLI